MRGREKGKEREGKKRFSRCFDCRSSIELDSPRTKVGPRNESYAWVPKSEFFVEALRGRGFLLHWFLFI